MKQTIQVSRSEDVEKQFQAHLTKLRKKYPEIKNFLSSEAVEVLRNEGIEIETITEFDVTCFAMQASHPYPDTKHHVVFYPSTTTEGTNLARNDTRMIKTALTILACTYAQRHAYDDFAIIVKKVGTLPETPHIHLLHYT